MRRPAYTLLEVLLSIAISSLLLIGLYVTLQLQTQNAKDGRQVIEEANLTRAVLVRMGNDISQNLAPVPPVTGSSSTTPSAGTGGGAAPATPTDGSASATPAPTTTSTSSVVFNQGVIGDNLEGTGRLVLYASRVPREMNFLPRNLDSEQGRSPTSDLRRIAYWIVMGDGDEPLGLARQEFLNVTADDDYNQLPPDIPDAGSYVIAPEVKDLQLRFWDGTAWSESWDGAELGSDNKTPKGPPLAIELRVGILPKGKSYNKDDLKYYRHVVVLPTANGKPRQATTDELTQPSTETTPPTTGSGTSP